MKRNKERPIQQDYYLYELVKLQKAGVIMQGFFTLGFLYFTYIVFMRQYTDFWSNFILIYFMIMLIVALLYSLKPIKKNLDIQVKSEK